MQKTTKIIGHFHNIKILDTTNKPIELPNGITIILHDNNLTIELLILPTQHKNTHIGNYTIIIKES